MESIRRWFYLAFFSGFFWFAVVAIGGFSGSWQLMGVLIVVLYGVVVWKSYSHSVAAIDSIYYLGFIFTLLALFISLLPSALSQSMATPEQILSSFALALGTTLAGLIFRTMLMQFSVVEETSIAEMQNGLVNATRDFSQQLRRISSELGTVSTEVFSAFETFTNELSSMGKETVAICQSTITEASEAMDKSSGEFTDSMKKGVRVVDGIVSDAGANMASTGEELSESIAGIAEGLGRMRDEVVDIKKEMLRLNRSSNNQVKTLVNFLNMGMRDNVRGLIKESKESFGLVAEDVKSRFTELRSTTPQLDEVSKSMMQTIDVLNNYGASLEKSTDTAKKAFMNVGAASKKVEEMSNNLDAMNNNLQRFSNFSTDMDHVFSDIREGFSQAQTAHLNVLSDNNKAFESKLKNLDDYSRKISDLTEYFVEQSGKAQEANAKLSQAILESTKLVAEQMRFANLDEV